MYEHRLDYVKASMSLHTENAQQMSKIWYDTFEGEERGDDEPRSAHVNSVRNNPDGTRLYVFEAWGPACIAVTSLSFDVWAAHLDRMDVRLETEVTRAGVDRLYSYIRDNKHGNRNVQLYDSKARSKRKGRDTGGFGIALGSHKSDLRITWYVRGTSQGAMEFQVAGDKLERSASVYLNMVRTGQITNNALAWSYLENSLYALGLGDIKETIGLDTYSMGAILADEAPLESEVEQKLALVDSILDGLPPDALHSALTSIQMRLF